jgi:REP element-mobilizing transposase RayT
MLKTPILPDKYYHIFNKANNKELIFRDSEDYQFFLLKIGEVVVENIDIFSFCLLPNHFHLLIKPKFHAKSKGPGSINESLRKLFQLYVQYYNKKYNRKGSLFYKSFRRIEIKDDLYLKYLLFYIHFNPQKANLVACFQNYIYSSYRFFVNNKETKLRKDIVFQWFDNSLEGFEQFHRECLELKIGSLGTPSPGLESLFPLPLPKFHFL